jgi:hypothetical protein
MATTRSLNSEKTVWVTTYAKDGSRCYDISMKIGEKTQATRTFTEQQLCDMLVSEGGIRYLMQPEMIL